MSDARPTPEAGGLAPAVLRDLVAYAQQRLAAGDGRDALAALEADQPDLVAAYGLGFCPRDFRDALPRPMRAACAGLRLAGAVVAPAFDEAGAVVDLLVVPPPVGGRSPFGLLREPRGMLAPATARDARRLVVTDHFRALARLFREGYRDALLLRGPLDAERNAARLAAAGVAAAEVRARRPGPIAAALRAAGLRVDVLPLVEEERPPAAPVAAPAEAAPASEGEVPAFAEADRAAGVLVFEAGPVRYAVEWRDDGDPRRRVAVRCAGRAHEEPGVHLGVEASRQRFAGNAARRVGVPAERIARHLAALLGAVRAREDAEEAGERVPVLGAEREEAERFLAAGDLLDRVAADLGALGWPGEERAKVLLYVAATSRLLDRPLWAVFRAAAGAAPWQALGMVAALVPPESVVVHHRLTASVLAQADRRSLRHALLLVDQAEAMRPEAALGLRILAERGGVGWASVAPAARTASGAPLLGEARGPVAVLAAAAGPLDHRCRDCFLALSVDESPEQTARVLAEQARRRAPRPVEVEAIVRRHRAAQRLLERAPVAIPFADRIAFPATSVRHRDDHARLLALVEAIALLRQRQRRREAGAIVAEEADFDDAVRLAGARLGAGGDGLSDAGRALLGRLYAARLAACTMADLAALLPDWTRWAFRAALQELVDFGYLESPRSVRGRARRYELAARAASEPRRRGIHLRPPDAPAVEVGELAEAPANFPPTLTPGARAG